MLRAGLHTFWSLSMAVSDGAESAGARAVRISGLQQIPKAKSTGMLDPKDLEEPPSVNLMKGQQGGWVLDVRAWILSTLRKTASQETVPWSRQVPPREPCYLVELLDQGWFERNVIGPRRQRRPTHKLPAITEGEVRRLLGDEQSLPTRGPVSPTEGSQVSAGGEAVVRGRTLSSRASRAQARRSSSVDAVRLARVGEDELGDGLSAFSRARSISTNTATLRSCSRLLGMPQLEPQTRGRSLTDTDLEELQGFIDLGFNFPRNATSPQMAAALPALKLYHAVESVQSRLISSHKVPAGKAGLQQSFVTGLPLGTLSEALTATWQSEIAAARAPELSPPEPWMVPNPEDNPANVKMHLRVWARTVATAVRQAC